MHAQSHLMTAPARQMRRSAIRAANSRADFFKCSLGSGLGAPLAAPAARPGGTAQAALGPRPPGHHFASFVECHEALLQEVARFLADSPQDVLLFCRTLSKRVCVQVRAAEDALWNGLYERRWPAFHTSVAHRRLFEEWQRAYRETLDGKVECVLEIFDREKKRGFAMACLPAQVQYVSCVDSYVARYVSASEVHPESIPAEEGYRLRFCPPSARQLLQPGVSQPGLDMRTGAPPPPEKKGLQEHDGFQESPPTACDEIAAYPHRVLEGIEGLTVGQGVELQWKMQQGSPFGWWYGRLEALHQDGALYRATLTFDHFPTTSRWHRLEICFGDDRMRMCDFGGFTGGIRYVSPDEDQHWQRFFPEGPLQF